MPSDAIAQSLAKLMFSSPCLSLALVMQPYSLFTSYKPDETNHCSTSLMQTSMDHGQEMMRVSGRRKSREEEMSRSDGSHNNIECEDAQSGDDDYQDRGDDGENPPKKKRKKKKHHRRHTPYQIQQLEAVFNEFPHPDEKQRLELSTRLCLETRQIKFWFQNRRTQMKTQLERIDNSMLRQENDKLRAENMSIRSETINNPICTTCGGPALIGEISFEEQHLRIENARLKDELQRACTLAAKFLGHPISSYTPPMPNPISGFGDSGSVYMELALAAMDELVKMVEIDEPLWIRIEGGREVLNEEEYLRTFTPSSMGLKPNAYVTEASRESGTIIINSLALVETLMDSNKWGEMFGCMIARNSTTNVISSGMGGTRNGALQLMRADIQVISPLVPVREMNFLRFSKQHGEGMWAVVDVSIDETSSYPPNCRRLPSGCVVQDMPNGYSKVKWVEHTEYDEEVVHHLYKPLIRSGMGFGAQRWLATLQRQCQSLAILVSPPLPNTVITPLGRRSMLKLARRMIDNFCAGVCPSTIHKWNNLNHAPNVDKDVRVMTRKSINHPGEPSGIVLSAATSVWLPVSPQSLFDFLRNERLRSEWDILSNGGPMQEMAYIAKGTNHANCVSLLSGAGAMNANQSSMLILQETCTDVSGSLVVYAPVDIPAMYVVMNGGDSANVALLPSGFSIVPDGPGSRGSISSNEGSIQRVNGSLLTVGFQILVNSLPTAKLSVESVETVRNLISCTVLKIKSALRCES